MEIEHQHLKFLGFFGICREAYRIVFSWRKMFAQITLAFILPLSFISFLHAQLSKYLFLNIAHDEVNLVESEVPIFIFIIISDFHSTGWTFFLLFQAAYVLFYLIFSVLSTSVISYTIACISAGLEVSFRKGMSVVPKVWKRVLITYATVFLAVCAYHLVALLSFLFLLVGALFVVALLVLFFHPVPIPSSYVEVAAVSIWWVVVVLYIVGLVTLGIVWQLASTISVLEDSKGSEAMRKSSQLIKGKLWVSTLVFFLNVILLEAFEKLVLHEVTKGKAKTIGYTILYFLVPPLWSLFGCAVQTIAYLACKSYHHQNIEEFQINKEEFCAPLEGHNIELN